MNYESVWKLLEALLVELRAAGVVVPPELVDDLKSAKTLTGICRTESTCSSVASDIALYLDKVEPGLLGLAESQMGQEYAAEWQQRIEKARRQAPENAAIRSRFVTGISKGDHWIRIKTSNLIADSDLNESLVKLNLSCQQQDDGYLLVYGNKEKVKSLIREVSTRIKERNFCR
jgi:hypothetical protein